MPVNVNQFKALAIAVNSDLARSGTKGFPRSSLNPLLLALSANPVDLDAVYDAMAGISRSRRTKYQTALNYVLQNLALQQTHMPNGFSWMQHNVGGMKKFDGNGPGIKKAALWLRQNNVRMVISIERSGARLTKTTIKGVPGMEWRGSFLADWHAPSVDHLLAYCRTVQTALQKGAVATHCWGGTGRTGCFLAAYAIFSGKCQTASAALPYVRRNYNVHSVEMKAQYNALARLADHLKRGRSLPHDSPSLDHAGGHWHGGHKDDGIGADPGHMIGTGPFMPSVYKQTKKMISKDGIADSSPPYITTASSALAQKV